MSEFLLFRLYGPLAAWGTVAVGQERPSDAHPGKSAILGLLGAAMGVVRDDETTHRAMAGAYGYGVRVEVSGTLLRDYHTAQVPPARRGVSHLTRRQEILDRPLNTILSTREYRCDALHTVALWVRSATPPFTLAALREGLCRPRFSLYLGRKSCPVGLPVEAQLVSADSLLAAFDQGQFAELDLALNDTVLLYWESDTESGIAPLQTITRRDLPLNRQRWQFGERREHQALLRRDREG